jgi:hypothetical protein
MTIAELETAIREGVHPVVLVFDNERYGTIHDHQVQRGMLPVATDLGPVDWVRVAEGFGALGARVDRDEDLEPALRVALSASLPTVLHLVLDRRWASVDRFGDAEPVVLLELPEPQPEPEPEPEDRPDAEPETEVSLEAEPEANAESEAEPQPNAESEAEPQPEAAQELEPRPEAEQEAEREPDPVPEPEPEPMPAADLGAPAAP